MKLRLRSEAPATAKRMTPHHSLAPHSCSKEYRQNQDMLKRSLTQPTFPYKYHAGDFLSHGFTTLLRVNSNPQNTAKFRFSAASRSGTEGVETSPCSMADGLTDKIENWELGGRRRGKGGLRGGRGGGGRRGEGREVAISKAMSKLLRHAAEDEGLVLDSEGFGRLDLVVSIDFFSFQCKILSCSSLSISFYLEDTFPCHVWYCTHKFQELNL